MLMRTLNQDTNSKFRIKAFVDDDPKRVGTQINTIKIYSPKVAMTPGHPDAYRADGAYGQFIIVLPNQNMVVVLTQCSTGDLGRETELIWQVLLRPATSPKAVRSLAAWQKQLSNYALPTVRGGRIGSSLLFRQVWTLEANVLGWTTLELRPACGQVRMLVTDADG